MGGFSEALVPCHSADVQGRHALERVDVDSQVEY